jgi:cysteine synthase B
LLDQIGHTPLLRLRNLAPDGAGRVALYAKAEHLNPSGSLKDRSTRAMILAALASGTLTPGRSILDATSGNAGISYAMLGAALGYGVTLCLPGNATPERKRILQLFGARIIESDPLQGSDGARCKAGELQAADPEAYCHVDQYNNDANWRAHFDTTAPELWTQTGGRITHFLAGVGTSGLFIGTARRLKELNPALVAVAVQPDRQDHRLAGLKHMKTAMVPGIYDPSVADLQMEVSSEEGEAMTRRLALEEGLLVGPSSGANVAAALRLAPSLPPNSVLVTILFDAGTRYLAAPFWTSTPPR